MGRVSVRREPARFAPAWAPPGIRERVQPQPDVHGNRAARRAAGRRGWTAPAAEPDSEDAGDE